MGARHGFPHGSEDKHHRFLDVSQEPRRMFQPIEGYQQMPLVPLEKAVESIVSCCPDIHRHVVIAMSNCENPADGLDQNESASIYLYTMEWKPMDKCLSYVLNKTLRTANRQQLKPWYSYLKLILTALQKLPPQNLTVWRAGTLDLSQQYEIGKRYVWWAFSSCTQAPDILETDQFLGNHGRRTLFNIECQNGKAIRSHSYIAVEEEILLLPATQFEVIDKSESSSDLHIIHLKQVDPLVPLIELPLRTMIVQPTISVKKNEEQRSTWDDNSCVNETSNEIPIKSSTSSHQNINQLPFNSLKHVEQSAVSNRSHSPVHANEISNDGPTLDNQNPVKSSFAVDTDDKQHSSHHQLTTSTRSKHHSKPLTPSLDGQEPDDSVTRHPSCQFRADKKWLDLQFHEKKTNDKSETTLIKKPNELEEEMEDPPGPIDPGLVDRIQGSMIGMALGDALGAHVEFRPRQFLKENPVTGLVGGGTWGLEKGQFTDDTSMALCLANSLVARCDFIPYDQLVRYKWWNDFGYMSSTGQCFDIGAATSQSINEFKRKQRNFAKEKQIPDSQIDHLSGSKLLGEFDTDCSEEGVAGNGALMRLAPVPLFFFRDECTAIEFSGRSGKITHGDKKAYDACRFYGALIVAALQGWDKERILAKKFYSERRQWFGKEPLHDDIKKIAEGSYKKKGGYEEGIRGKGYIVHALEAALWAFWSDGNSFEKGALAAVNLGDDTDTTAAIYGQLAGAYYGYKKLPSHWLEHLYAHKFMKTLSKWIAYEGEQWEHNRQVSSKH